MDYISILKDISIYPGISGHEQNLAKHIAKIFKKHCENVEIDEFSSVIGFKKGKPGTGKKVMVSAHIDEIGLMVKSIDDEGFIRVSNVGGVDSKVLLAQEVVVHGKKDVFGVIGATPPHLLKPADAKKAVKMEDLILDTGLSALELKRYVSVGDVITFKAEPFALGGNKLSSKSLDNRAGVVTLIGIMDKLGPMRHNYDTYFVASSQEEVGLRGANICAYNIKPDLAIVIDVCHGKIPGVSKEEASILGKGPVISVGPNLHKEFSRGLINMAKSDGIIHQIDVEPGNTGTEAWAIQVSRSGIPTLLVSIPLKYMHTVIETLDMADIKNAVKLIAEFITLLGRETEDFVCC